LAGQNAVWRQNLVPGVALVFHDADHPSSLLLPIVPMETAPDPHPFVLPQLQIARCRRALRREA